MSMFYAIDPRSSLMIFYLIWPLSSNGSRY